MKSRIFSIPKEVYFYCVFPILLIIITCLIFYLIYKKKKGSHYYVFTVNYFFQLSGLIISALMMALLIGYAIATIYIIAVNHLLVKYGIFVVVVSILPFIPTTLFIWLCFKIHKNMQYKKELDNYQEEN